MTKRPDTLDREERELAARLARIAPRGEPTPDMDARILAMAADAVRPAHASSAPSRRPRRRWPVWLGVAASLTAVAGLVWRLEPLLHQGQPVRYEAPAPVAADTAPNGQRQPIDYIDGAAPPPPAPPASPPALTSAAPTLERPAPRSAAAPIARSPSPAPAAEPAAKAVADASAIEAAPAPPPAPPPPPVPMQRKQAQADADLVQEVPRRPVPAPVEAVAAPAAARAAAAEPPPKPKSDAEARSVTVTGTNLPPPEQDRAGFDARPPATADTPEVQRAWLARIRELRDGGQQDPAKLDEARASLKAYQQRFPKADIPADLKPLLPASAPGT